MKKPRGNGAHQLERQFELTSSIIPAPSVVGSQLAQSESKHEAELQVSDMLSKAYGWLTRAVKTTNVPPLQAKQMRAYVYTIQEATKQRDLSRSIQLDAQEMARRADYALGKAIRDGQANGTITTRSDNERTPNALSNTDKANRKISPSSILNMSATERTQIYTFADNASPDEFESALSDAKAEGNLSRANLVRKVKAPKPSDSDHVMVVDPDTGEFTEQERPVSKRLAQIFDTLILSATPQPSVMDMVDFDQIPAGQAAIWHGQLSEAINSLKSIDRKLAKKASK